MKILGFFFTIAVVARFLADANTILLFRKKFRMLMIQLW